MRPVLVLLVLALAPSSPGVRADDPAPATADPVVAASIAAGPVLAAPGAVDPLFAASVAIDPVVATSVAPALDPVLAATVVPAPALAAKADAARPAAKVEAAAAPRAPGRLPRFGVALGAGFPEFATLSVLYRPWRFLRLSAGPTWNYVGWGGNVGLTLVPVNWWITPLLGVEAGKFLRSDYSKLVKSDDAETRDLKPLLRRVDYSYTAVDLGLELGSPRSFALTLRFGLSFVWLSAAGTGARTTDGGTTLTFTNPSLRATLPSAKLGLQYWF
jgi:hypothetical protein